MAKRHLFRFGESPDCWETADISYDLIKNHIGEFVSTKKGTIGEKGHPLSNRVVLIEIEKIDCSDFREGFYMGKNF